MKSVKGKFLKKFKSIKPGDYLNQDRVLQVLVGDGNVNFLPKITNFASQRQNQSHTKSKEMEIEEKEERSFVPVKEPHVIDVSELMMDFGNMEEEEQQQQSEETGFGFDCDEKENIMPPLKGNVSVSFREKLENSTESDTGQFREDQPLLETTVSCYRRPDLNSNSLFDPNLLAAFEQAVKDYKRLKKAGTEQEKLCQPRNESEKEAERKRVKSQEDEAEKREKPEHAVERPSKTQGAEDDFHTEFGNEDPLSQFERRCPPGGERSVIFYTTTLRGIRKTFEDCSRVRFLLESFRVLYYERDVSMHKEYKEELWRVMERKAMPPVLFIKGRCIGGAQEVCGLHEQGKFRALLRGTPATQSNSTCEGCAGVRFVLCFNCSGSHKVVSDNGLRSNCLLCNENGLIVCPVCC